MCINLQCYLPCGVIIESVSGIRRSVKGRGRTEVKRKCVFPTDTKNEWDGCDIFNPTRN